MEQQESQATEIAEAVLKSIQLHLRDVLKQEIGQSGIIREIIKSELASSTSDVQASSNQQPYNTSTITKILPESRVSIQIPSNSPSTLTQQPQPQQDSFEAALALVGLKTEDSPQQTISQTAHSVWPTMYAQQRGPLPTPNTTPMAPPRSSRQYGDKSLRTGASVKRSRSPDDENGLISDWTPVTALDINGISDDGKRHRTDETNGEPVTPSTDGEEYNHYNPHSQLPPYQPPTTRQAHKNELFSQPHFAHIHPHPYNIPGGRGHSKYRCIDEGHDDDYEEAFAAEDDHEGCHCRAYLQRVIACVGPHCPIQYIKTSDPSLNKRPNAAITSSRSRATTPTSPSITASSKKSSPRPPSWKCDLCGTTTTSQRRPGPKGRSTLCNACWTRGRKKSKAAAQQAAQEQLQQEQASSCTGTLTAGTSI